MLIKVLSFRLDMGNKSDREIKLNISHQSGRPSVTKKSNLSAQTAIFSPKIFDR
jgi:hypothetical protein